MGSRSRAGSRARAARTKRDRTRAALLSAADPAFAARGWARTRVEDIASAAVFLASEQSTLMTGAALVIDGGFTSQLV